MEREMGERKQELDTSGLTINKVQKVENKQFRFYGESKPDKGEV